MTEEQLEDFSPPYNHSRGDSALTPCYDCMARVLMVAEIRRLRDALMFYADENNWCWRETGTETFGIPDAVNPVQNDAGGIARAALAPQEATHPKA